VDPRLSCFVGAAIVSLFLSLTVSVYSDDSKPFGQNFTHYHLRPIIPKTKDAGIQSVRVMIRWELIEPTDGGPFDWSPIESHVAEAIRNGLEVIGTFQTFPSWAGLDTAVPSDPADPFFSSYYSFIFSVATQFAGRIRYYSPLNEPVQAQTPYPALNIEIYKRLLQECHDAVVAADAEAMIFGPETYQHLSAHGNCPPSAHQN